MEEEVFVNSCQILSLIESKNNFMLKHLLFRRQYSTDEQGYSYLLHALFSENYELIESLLDRGQNFNDQDISYLIGNKDLPCLSWQIESALITFLRGKLKSRQSLAISLLRRILLKKEFGVFLRLCQEFNLDPSSEPFDDVFKDIMQEQHRSNEVGPSQPEESLGQRNYLDEKVRKMERENSSLSWDLCNKQPSSLATREAASAPKNLMIPLRKYSLDQMKMALKTQ